MLILKSNFYANIVIISNKMKKYKKISEPFQTRLILTDEI